MNESSLVPNTKERKVLCPPPLGQSVLSGLASSEGESTTSLQCARISNNPTRDDWRRRRIIVALHPKICAPRQDVANENCECNINLHRGGATTTRRALLTDSYGINIYTT